VIDIIIARVLHVLAIVIWIGGISMVTTVVLPAVRRQALGENSAQAFQAIEGRFVWQARTALIVVGLTGLYMTTRLELWTRFRSAEFWWMHAMVCLWLLFSIILFVAEPLMSRRSRAVPTSGQFAARLVWLQMAHWVLLGLSLATIAGAVSGSQGWSF
jgi:uncharacterized membrane protein